MTEPVIYPPVEAAEPPKAFVIMVHGLTRNCTVFDKAKLYLEKIGLKGLSFDQAGHGIQRENPVDFEESSKDLIIKTQRLRKECPRVPVYALGESSGALVVLNSYIQRPDLFDGLILVSPGTSLHVFSPLLTIPDFFRGITKLSRPLDVVKYIKRYASNDPYIIQEMIADPIDLKTLDGHEMLTTYFFMKKVAKLPKKVTANIPILVIQGEKDRIVKDGSVRKLFRRLRSESKTMVVFANYGHVLLQTHYAQPAVLEYLQNWLLKTIDNRTKVTYDAN